MEPTEIMESLLELASQLGLEVRVLRGGGGGESELPPTSAFCRVKGKALVMLSPRDPIAFQIRVLSSWLRSHAGAVL